MPPSFSYNGTCDPVRGTQLQTPLNCPRDLHGQRMSPSDSCTVCCYWQIVEGAHQVSAWMAMGPTCGYLMHHERLPQPGIVESCLPSRTVTFREVTGAPCRKPLRSGTLLVDSPAEEKGVGRVTGLSPEMPATPARTLQLVYGVLGRLAEGGDSIYGTMGKRPPMLG